MVTKNTYIGVLLISTSLLIFSCKKTKEDVVNPQPVAAISAPASSYDNEMPTNWLKLHLFLIKDTPGYAPPVAARSLAYASLALYESVVSGMPQNMSLSGQLNGISGLPQPDSTLEYNWALAASTSQYTILREFFKTTSDKNQVAIDSVRKFYEAKLKVGSSDPTIERSIRLGSEIALKIFEISKKDGGQDGQVANFPANYVSPGGIGSWKPTGSQVIPLLPYWGSNKTMASENLKNNLETPLTFSFEKNSAFFAEAKNVYFVSQNLTSEQKQIALYFADGGGTITPPGHHFNIANIIVKKEKATLDKVAEVFVKVGLSLNDAFISAWRGKYEYNLMRPSTYITQSIAKTWSPFLTNPPFPEYASGHSTAAGATVEVLESIFGKTYAFEDNTYSPQYPNRKFDNFEAYGQETSLSRVYGGIHYRFSCDNGYACGRKVAKNILNLKFKK
ncbi:vanadium-dependent haloperoxidase [Lacihabitans lacunae]|uniref:Vanadium-dependent haloperoxidase n=1 Tax=Lacihabitans lacunae TaxID=1028214 RepID=A0ABV7Z152_9BACT